MKKIIGLLLLMFIFTGCTSDVLIDNYNNMQMGEELTGYSLRIKISGINNNSFIVRNYNDSEYSVEIKTYNVNNNYFSEEYSVKSNLIYYYKDDVIYELIDNEYVVSNFTNMLNDTNIYLESLKINKGIKQLNDEELGSNTYQAYEIKPKKSVIKDLLSHLGISETYDDASLVVLIDNDGYVYSAEYSIDETKIYAYYSKFNAIDSFNIK